MDKYIVYRALTKTYKGGQNSPRMVKPRCPRPTNGAILATKKMLNLSRAAKFMVSIIDIVIINMIWKNDKSIFTT